MNKLVLVDGHSGAGKTTVSTYMESLGFIRQSFGDYSKEFITEPAGYKTPIHFFRRLCERKTDFWRDFKRTRNYSFKDAVEILEKYRFNIEYGLGIPDRYARAYLEAVWNGYLDLRDAFLSTGNVIMDIFGDHFVMPLIFDADAEKYHIRLLVDKEIAVQRKMKQRRWDRKRAEESIDRTKSYLDKKTTPHGVILLEYLNESKQDLEKIKTGLKEMLC